MGKQFRVVQVSGFRVWPYFEIELSTPIFLTSHLVEFRSRRCSSSMLVDGLGICTAGSKIEKGAYTYTKVFQSQPLATSAESRLGRSLAWILP